MEKIAEPFQQPRAFDRLSDDHRWAAVADRDAAFDGVFVYAVASTGIYCRPSCPARRPDRKRVRYFAGARAAEAEGYRACRRCRPDQAPTRSEATEAVIAACRSMAEAETAPTLDMLAADAGLSRWHFHRLFKQATGVTPKAYAAAQRRERARAGLRSARTVTEAIHHAGFNSAGRFYADMEAMLGMNPTQYRSGGAGAEIRYAVTTCWLGPVLVAATARGVCAILFDDDAAALPEVLRRQFPKARLIAGDGAFSNLVASVVNWLNGREANLELPLDISGTAFQIRVWEALRQIPSGSTASYSEIAEKIGAPAAVRAVAGACAANPIAVAVPCHRVIGKNGKLTGYRGGMARKRALLKREAEEA